ncbi:MAG: hypothetical protein KW788_04350 [Candidatus Doudnabacteria bacterium]|nr:hypothetical protein [Candidatus Doudnabacteria bacterium]
MNIKKLSLITLAVILIAATATAAEYFVKKNANDSNTQVPEYSNDRNESEVTVPQTDKAETIQAEWVWENQGCGSSSPCIYKVCAGSSSANCYTCVGRYDKLSQSGEKLPAANESPITTTNFTCRRS